MFDTFIKRENQIFEILQEFADAGLEFVVVGGYAVSAYKHRFSVDVDIVVKRNDMEKFTLILAKNKFVKTIFKQLENEYSSQFVRYEKKDELPVSFDMLIDGLGVRQTNAAFGYDLLRSYSEKKKIRGIEKEVVLLVPRRELLVAMKLHAGRATDLRDVAALCKGLDLALIRKVIQRGDTAPVKESIAKLISLLDNTDFINSFKGIFLEKKYDLDTQEIKKLRKLIL